jgi:hypothetical protein
VLTSWPYVWQLDPGHTYNEHLVLVLKTGCDSIFVLYPSFVSPSIYRLTLWDPRLGPFSFHMQDGGFGKENMSSNDLGLLLGVIEIQMVLHMLAHGIRFDILWHLHFYVSILIHPPYACLKCELLLCSLDLIACIIIALSCILLLVRLDLFAACGVHWSDYSCFLCGLICSPLCVTMPWLRPMFVPSLCASPV